MTKPTIDRSRRDFLRLAGLGGAVFVSGMALGSHAAERRRAAQGGSRGTGGAPAESGDFYFVQLSDPHWGFEGPAVNPDARGTLKKAVAAVNALDEAPDFVVFTGDLTHTTDDAKVRSDRMRGFQDIASGLKPKNVFFMAGEHDAALDEGDAFQKLFGELHYTFDHKGVHFIVLDNVSDPAAIVGEKQLAWLKADLAKHRNDHPIVVLTHRPLFDLAPDWDWATRDGQAVIDALLPYSNVTVFYGHIHQENHHATGHIQHHAAKGLMFALPAPLSVAKKAPIPWDATAPYKGLGFRDVEAAVKKAEYEITELPVARG
ncbi:MAG TPA: metallophosphoesterase [Candidatus Binatia bacterium]|nr:metallophosphoesterase [Candidatus Binatia bacterium]